MQILVTNESNYALPTLRGIKAGFVRYGRHNYTLYCTLTKASLFGSKRKHILIRMLLQKKFTRMKGQSAAIFLLEGQCKLVALRF